jgi:hypothetical protein
LSLQVVAGSGELELRRASAGVSSLLLALVTVAIAEAALWALLALFSYILNLWLILDLGTARLAFQPRITEYVVIQDGVTLIQGGIPVIELYGSALIGSVVFCATCGLVAATRTFRRWRPIA